MFRFVKTVESGVHFAPMTVTTAPNEPASRSARTPTPQRFAWPNKPLREFFERGCLTAAGSAWRTSELMKTTRQLTAIIECEDEAYVARCPELDVASQGATVESARKNLIEALELFFELADATKVARRPQGEVFVTRVDVLVGT